MFTYVLPLFTFFAPVYLCLPMFTHVYLRLLKFTNVYSCLPMITPVYLCLSMFTLMFNNVYSCMFSYVYPYLVCLPVDTCLLTFTPVTYI